ncbi:MAG: hypothetical protein ACK40G_02840 [Cytophagaceae bacterium]
MNTKITKFMVFVLLLLLAPVIAGTYGALHDQFTFTISPEFFTKYRFINVFGDQSSKWQEPGYQRLGAAIVGWKYSWKLGLLAGVVLSFTGLIHSNAGRMLSNTLQSYFIALIVSFLVGVIGLATGIFTSLDANMVNIPEGVENVSAFKAVETMHNFSYMGGIIGMLSGIWLQIHKRKKQEHLLSKEHQPGE